MSQRYLTPTNLFYHWADPTPNPALPDDPFKDFPEPSTGDIYFNVSSSMIRVFYEGGWHDAGGGGGGGAGSAGEVIVQSAEPTETGLELWVDTDDAGTWPTNLIVATTAPPTPPPAGTLVNTVFVQY